MGGGGMPGGGKSGDVGSVAMLKGVVAMVSGFCHSFHVSVGNAGLF